MNTKDKTVYVGVSGGVDSSVSAALLKEQGYNVVGVFIKVWQPDFLKCDWEKERLDAMRVCARLDIPFLTLDLAEEYKREVADYMIDEYRKGRTPNPDVMCNKHIKFGSFLKFADEKGADYIATGHYAQVGERDGVFELKTSKDSEKDQTYFLWTLTQKELSKSLFPVGGYRKEEVRKLAQKFDLPTAEKKDSQGICFLGQVDLEEFLSHYLELKEGDVLDTDENVVGTHRGAAIYTLGQRHGFTILEKTTERKPYYVVAKNIEKNTLTVSHKPQDEDFDRKSVELEDVNWIAEAPKEGQAYQARIRHGGRLYPCTISDNVVSFEESQSALARGQSLVLFQEDVCIGGGVISW